MILYMPIVKQNPVFMISKNLLIFAILISASVCHAATEISLWTISAGEGLVLEFLSENHRPYCGIICSSYAVVDRPDEIFVSSTRKDILQRIRSGEIDMGPPSNAYVLNLKTKTISLISLDRFLELDIMFEDLPVGGYEDYPEIKYGGDPDGHRYVAPIQREGEDFIAALSSKVTTTEKTTFGIPSIIPFMGRQKWFQKEKSHAGTLFLEIFDKKNPSKPLVQLQKQFKEHRFLPSIFEVASWTQGAKQPLLMVVDNESLLKEKKGRILVIRTQQ